MQGQTSLRCNLGWHSYKIVKNKTNVMIRKQIAAVPHYECTNTQGLIMLHRKLD